MILKALLNAPLHWLRPLYGKRGKAPDTRPQDGIRLDAYLGRWYEQARFDHFFERGLDNVYTDYTYSDGTHIDIANTGYDRRGRQHRAQGRATHTADMPSGLLRVSFVPPYTWFTAPYHILYTDADYQEALVSGENARYLWLLTRARRADDATLRRLLDEASRRGFDISRLRLTRQNRKSAPKEI